MPNAATDGARPLALWFAHPAVRWIHALPVGSGRLADTEPATCAFQLDVAAAGATAAAP